MASVTQSERDRPTRTGVQAPGRMLGLALLLGWVADLLFYEERWGLSMPVFVLTYLAILFIVGRLEGIPPARGNLWLLAPLLFCAAMVPVRASPFLLFLNVGTTLLLLGLVTYYYAGGRASQARLRELLLAPLFAGGYSLVRPVRIVRALLERGRTPSERQQSLLPVARGLLLALPVVLVFGVLMASADLVFREFMLALLRFQIPPPLVSPLVQLLLILAAAWLLAGALAFALSPVPAGAPRPAPPAPLFSLGPVEVFTLLGTVNLLFAIFVWIQFTYLFGGEADLAAAGYTYAAYARRGFLELVAVSVLTLFLILALRPVTRLDAPARAARFNLLCSVLIALVLVVLGSAFYRLRLYELAYGYTRLRLYSHVFMLALGGLFLWLLVTRWAPRVRFGIGAFGAGLGFVVVLNLLNPDAFIARQNLARQEATGKLDLRYLTWLSNDAVPVLLEALDRAGGPDRSLLLRNLEERLAHLEARARTTGWPSLHLAQRRARRLLRNALAEAASPARRAPDPP